MWRAFGNEAEAADPGFIPRFLAIDSSLYKSLFGEHTMMSFGLDLSKSAIDAIGESFGTAIPYVLLVVLLGGLYFVQQRMVAARAAISPTMSQAQQKLMQYLPVSFAVFQVFFLAALVVYYLFQTVLRIAQQVYITKAFYGHDESLGRQAQRAGAAAREEAAKSGESTGMFSQAKRELGASKGDKTGKPSSRQPGRQEGATPSQPTEPAKPPVVSKRVTPPKNRPTPSSSAKGRPTPSRKDAQPEKSNTRPKSSGK